MKKCFSVFLAVFIAASIISGTFSASVFASTDTPGVIDVNGTKYTKLVVNASAVYGDDVDGAFAGNATDGDINTKFMPKAGSTEAVPQLSSCEFGGIAALERVDLIRVYYKKASSVAPVVRIWGENRVYSSDHIADKGFNSFPASEQEIACADAFIDYDKTNGDNNIKMVFQGIRMDVYEIEFYKKLDLTVSGASIENGASDITNVNGGQPLAVTFSGAVDKTSVTADTVKFTSESGDVVEPTSVYSADDKTLKFDLKDLKSNTKYTFSMTTEVKSELGVALDKEYSLSFTTGEIVPFPYCDGRVIKEVTDFSKNIMVDRGRYAIDLKSAMPLLGVSVKLKEADSTKEDSKLYIAVAQRGGLDGSDYKTIPDANGVTVKNNTTDYQSYFLDAGMYRYFALDGSSVVNNENNSLYIGNIDDVKVYTSVSDVATNLTKISNCSSRYMFYGDSDWKSEPKFYDGKFFGDNGCVLKSDKGLRGFDVLTEKIPNTTVKKIRIWYKTDNTVDYSVYKHDAWSAGLTYLKKEVTLSPTGGSIACADIDINNTAGARFVLMGSATTMQDITVYEIEVYKALDDSARFVSASSSTEGVSADELAKVYDGNENSYCNVKAKDIILKLDKPTLASAVKVRYYCDSSNINNHSIYAASSNDENAYDKIGEFKPGGETGEDEGLDSTDIIKFPERIIRYVKIERPSVGSIEIADVKIYSENTLPGAEDGKHLENVMAGLKPTAVTVVDDIKCYVDQNTSYLLTDGKLDKTATLGAYPDADVNVGPAKPGAQYDIDLGQVYTLSGINMGWSKDNDRSFVGCFTLYGSQDGENYTKLADFNIGFAGTGVSSACFAPQECRYLRLVKGLGTPESFTKTEGVKCATYGYGFTTYVTELEVYGLVEDSNDLVISNNDLVRVGDGYNWSISLRNHTGKAETYTAIAACYNTENALLQCIDIGTVTVDEFDYSKVINIHSDKIPEGTTKIKTFLWSGDGNARPIIKANTLEIPAQQ